LYGGYFVPGGVDPSGLTQAEADAVYASLIQLCDDANCLAKCPENKKCTVDKCKEEARKIAETYHNTFYMYRKPKSTKSHIKQGKICYQWAALTERSLDPIGLECWQVNLVSEASHQTNHTYVLVSLGHPLEPAENGQQRKNACARALDPWAGEKGGVQVFDPNNPAHGKNWNVLRDPSGKGGPKRDKEGKVIPPTTLGNFGEGGWQPWIEQLPQREEYKVYEGVHPADWERGKTWPEPSRPRDEWFPDLLLNYTPSSPPPAAAPAS